MQFLGLIKALLRKLQFVHLLVDFVAGLVVLLARLLVVHVSDFAQWMVSTSKLRFVAVERPATKWPDVFDRWPLFVSFPYLLPYAVAALITLLGGQKHIHPFLYLSYLQVRFYRYSLGMMGAPGRVQFASLLTNSISHPQSQKKVLQLLRMKMKR